MTLLDYALNRLNGLVGEVVVRSENVQANLERAGDAVFSGHFLLDLVREGVTREDAYAWVQSCALRSFETGENFLF